MVKLHEYTVLTFIQHAMQKQLIRHGNSYALVIDRPILELLGMSPSVPLKISTDGTSLILTPVTTPEPPKTEASPLFKKKTI